MVPILKRLLLIRQISRVSETTAFYYADRLFFFLEHAGELRIIILRRKNEKRAHTKPHQCTQLGIIIIHDVCART